MDAIQSACICLTGASGFCAMQTQMVPRTPRSTIAERARLWPSRANESVYLHRDLRRIRRLEGATGTNDSLRLRLLHGRAAPHVEPRVADRLARRARATKCPAASE